MENFERFLTGNKKLNFYVSKLFQTLCFKSRLFKIGFLCSKGVKEMKKDDLRDKKPVLE